MIKKISRIVSGVLILPVISICLSCTKQKNEIQPAPTVIEEELPSRAVKLVHLDEETEKYLKGKKIILVLGYGYNDEESSLSIREMADKNYGLSTETNDGLVKIITFPQDFQVSGKTRISALGDLLEGTDIFGMVIIGAPEGFCNAVAKMQDKSENLTLSYPVFNLLPQDDVLGAESTSDFVLDYLHKAQESETEVTEIAVDYDATQLIDNSIEMLIKLREPLKADSSLISAVKKIAGPDHTVNYYNDSETGLRSVNHFIFE